MIKIIPDINLATKNGNLPSVLAHNGTDRHDGAVTICEIKYTEQPFIIDKNYSHSLLNKAAVYKRETKTKKQVFFAMISANGLKPTIYSEELISGVVRLNDLFKEIQS